MATRDLRRMDDAGLTGYFVIYQSGSANVYDFADQTFKALGAATTPYVAATERTGICGTGKSYYDASINLSQIHPGVAAFGITILFFEQLGGAPAPATDTPRSQPVSLTIQSGDEIVVPVDVQFRCCAKSTSGTEIQVLAWLQAGQVPVDLATLDPAATCTATIYLYGSSIPVITLDSEFALNTLSQFEAEYSNPNFTADRLYTVELAIVTGGVTYTARRTFTVIP